MTCSNLTVIRMVLRINAQTIQTQALAHSFPNIRQSFFPSKSHSVSINPIILYFLRSDNVYQYQCHWSIIMRDGRGSRQQRMISLLSSWFRSVQLSYGVLFNCCRNSRLIREKTIRNQLWCRATTIALTKLNTYVLYNVHTWARTCIVRAYTYVYIIPWWSSTVVYIKFMKVEDFFFEYKIKSLKDVRHHPINFIVIVEIRHSYCQNRISFLSK